MRKQKEKAPAYQWYPKDALSSAAMAAMSNAAEGLYRRLLDHAWLENGLPGDVREIYPLAKCETRDQFDALWRTVSDKFPLGADGRRRNARQEQQRKAQRKYRQSRKLGARARWQKAKKSTDARALHVECSASALALASASSEVQVDQVHRRAVRAGLMSAGRADDPTRIIRRLSALCHADLIQPYVSLSGNLPNPDALPAALLAHAATKHLEATPEQAQAAAARALARWTGTAQRRQA